MSTPIFLSDSTTLAAGATSILNLSLLQAPQKRPMFVREIVFHASIPVTCGDFGGIVWAKLQAGRHALTNQFVPIWNFAPPYDRYYNALNNLGQAGARAAQVTTSYTVYRWILPKPLYVGAGGGIHCGFHRPRRFDSNFNAGVTGATITARCCVIGELAVGKQPDEIDVPYVSAFVAMDQAGTVLLKSGEQDFKNLLDKPLVTQRFVGALLGNTEGRNSPPTRYYNLSSVNEVRVGILDQYNRHVTAAPTRSDVNWESIFHPQHPAWTIRQILTPNQNFACTLSPAPTITTSGIPMISLVSSRKEAP
jgi:hypothetical protein